MKCGVLLTAVLAYGAIHASAAPTYQVELAYDQGAGTYWVYAHDTKYPGTMDNAGIASYGVVLHGVATIENQGPLAQLVMPGVGTFPAGGFSMFRSTSPLGGSQNTFKLEVPPDTADIVWNVGQVGGNLATLYPAANSFVGQVYGSSVLLATGTFTGDVSSLGFGTVGIEVFQAMGSMATLAAGVQTSVVAVPEPGVAMLLVIGVTLALRRNGARA